MRFLQEKLYKRHLPRVAADEYKIVSLDTEDFQTWEILRTHSSLRLFWGVLGFCLDPKKFEKNKWKKELEEENERWALV